MNGSTTVPPQTPPPSPPPPGPRHPAPTHPPTRDNAEILRMIDDSLIALLAVAYFGPCEQGTARSVEQVCAAEVLLHRLRSSRRAVADLRDALDLPARRYAVVAPAFAPGGPGLNHPLVPGEEPTPGSAVAAATAARESTGAVVAPGAGAGVPGGKVPANVPGCMGRGGGAVAAATFSLPVTPRFAMAEGDHRPIGSVQPLT